MPSEAMEAEATAVLEPPLLGNQLRHGTAPHLQEFMVSGHHCWRPPPACITSESPRSTAASPGASRGEEMTSDQVLVERKIIPILLSHRKRTPGRAR